MSFYVTLGLGGGNMKHLLIMILFIGCGMKVKHQVAGGITVPNVEIIHVFKIDESLFEDKCIEKYKNVQNNDERDILINACILQNQRMVEQLINALNGVNNNPVPVEN